MQSLNRSIANRQCLTLVFMLLASPASAQSVWIGGAVQRDVQRFPQDEVAPNRLDGASTGWRVSSAVWLWNHLPVVVEWSDAGAIEDARTTRVDVDGRAIVITSRFRHQTRALTALAGYGHEVASRVRIAYLLGVAFTRARREFTSNAPGVVLVRPSDRTVSGSAAIVDRFERMTGGIDLQLRIHRRVHILTGARAQQIELQPDTSGWSVRSFVGAGWMF
jgi:hypothetical protein